jgi:3-oxoacyl-[acyl-carrier protein] reductase
MDLEIGGASAIVCASSKGLGFACAAELAREGASVVICGRHADTLEDARRQIAERGGAVTAVVADVTTDDGRAALLAACPEPDILVNNAGGPPPGDFRDWRQA